MRCKSDTPDYSRIPTGPRRARKLEPKDHWQFCLFSVTACTSSSPHLRAVLYHPSLSPLFYLHIFVNRLSFATSSTSASQLRLLTTKAFLRGTLHDRVTKPWFTPFTPISTATQYFTTHSRYQATTVSTSARYSLSIIA